jgi:hypothetical protein
MVIGFAPVAFGQVVETKGQNYDLIEDFTIGEATWTSHPERINNNGWQNYFLQTENQKIIFKSNAVGGFIYDIPTCSYSLYENGYDGNLIIPSVSSVATYLKDGTWQNMAVNEESCDVNFSQNENGIFLTSTKNLTQTITNGTNANGTAITFDVETEKFTQEIKVDINSGIKETFKVWNEGNEELGISQTVHTGESITVGGNTIDIASFNGQSFDRQFLEENEAQIFEIAENLNYDFDLGFESLTGINIISESSFFDTTYKVNLDYSNGGFVNYLEIDPTFTDSGTGRTLWVKASTLHNTITSPADTWFTYSPSTSTGYFVGAEFDTSSIPTYAVLSSASFSSSSIPWGGGSSNCKLVAMSNTPQSYYSNSDYTGLRNDIVGSTTVLSSGSSFCTNGSFTDTINSAGITAFQNSISNGENVHFGFQSTGAWDKGYHSGGASHTFTLTYSVSTAPQPPTNLSTTTGTPIELSWTAPVDDGGSAITGYKVFRSGSEYPNTPLKNHNATQETGTTGINTSSNFEGIFHFDEVRTTTTDAVFNGGHSSAVARAHDGTWTKRGIEIQSGSDGVGKTIQTAKFDLISTGSPTGTGQFVIYDSSDNVLATSTSTYDLSTIPATCNSNTELTFDTAVTLSAGDRIVVELVSGSVDGSNWIGVCYNNSPSTIATGFEHSGYNGSWSNNDYDINIEFDSSPISGNDFIDDYSGNDDHAEMTPIFGLQTTFTDDFDTDDWTDSTADIGVDATTDLRLEYDIQRHTTNDLAYYDFGSEICETECKLRFKLQTITLTGGSGSHKMAFIGLSSVTGSWSTTGDHIGFHHQLSSNVVEKDIHPVYGDGVNYQTSHQAEMTQVLEVGTIWYEIHKVSDTDYHLSLFSANTYDSADLIEEDTFSISGIEDLRYFVVVNANDSTQSGNIIGAIDDVELIDMSTGTLTIKPSHIDTGYSNELQLTNAGLNVISSVYPQNQDAWSISGIITLNQTTSFPLMSFDSSGSEVLLNIDDSFISLSKGGTDIFNHVLTTPLGDGSANAITIKRSTGGEYETFVNGTRSPDSSTTDTTTLGTATNNLYYFGMDTSLANSGTWRIDELSIRSDEQSDQDSADFGNRILIQQVGTTGSSITSFDDNTVIGGNTYSYSVKATNAIGDSDFSTSQSGLAGTPPDAPTGLTTTIQDANTNPLDIYLQWSSPTNVGSGTLTGFEIWRDGALITTTGLVTTYTDTVPSSGTYSYQVKAVSTHGASGFSNSSNQTTPTVPNAITDLSATVDSDTQISLSWSAPTNGGSAITGYKVFQDGVQIATPTSASYVVTGLTSNTQYTFKVIAVNNVGDSADSNLVTPTTYETITGSINVSSTIQGATAKLTFTQNVTSGTPTPNFNTFTLKEGTTTIASNISSPYYLAIPDGTSHSYTITSTDNAHWNTPTISGTASNIVAGYAPNWENSISYNYTRSTNNLSLFVNQDRQGLWDLTCNYRTTAEIIAKSNGINGTMTNDWYYSDAQSISDADTVYVECRDETGIILSFTSYNTNRIGAGISLLDNVFSEWTGTPVALVFVLLVAGLFSGRSAPAGILLVLAIVGVMGFIGLLVIDELIWAFILLAGILGLFMGKRFL